MGVPKTVHGQALEQHERGLPNITLRNLLLGFFVLYRDWRFRRRTKLLSDRVNNLLPKPFPVRCMHILNERSEALQFIVIVHSHDSSLGVTN